MNCNNFKNQDNPTNSEREIYRRLEQEWRKSLKRYSSQELLKLFPEAEKVIPEKIKENERRYKKIERIAKKLLKEARKIAGENTWFTESFIKAFCVPDLIKYSNNIMRLNSYSQPTNKFVENFNQKIERAREYPILELASGSMDLRVRGRTYSALCPFHNERTPSFFLYPESNTYHCFGCGVHGDVISLAQHLYNISFKEAVLRLQ